MKKRWAIRRWVYTSGCLLCVALWIASAWWAIGWNVGSNSVSLGAGVAGVANAHMIRMGPHYSPWPGVAVEQIYAAPAVLWWIEYEWPANFAKPMFVFIPLWMPAVLLAVPSFFAWKRHFRRGGAGVCGACGYSRAGLPHDSPCPECGRAKAAST